MAHVLGRGSGNSKFMRDYADKIIEGLRIFAFATIVALYALLGIRALEVFALAKVQRKNYQENVVPLEGQKSEEHENSDPFQSHGLRLRDAK